MASSFLNLRFENDVNQYGYLTNLPVLLSTCWFENDVNQYGYLTSIIDIPKHGRFENDVNQYGYLTCAVNTTLIPGLRMM